VSYRSCQASWWVHRIHHQAWGAIGSHTGHVVLIQRMRLGVYSAEHTLLLHHSGIEVHIHCVRNAHAAHPGMGCGPWWDLRSGLHGDCPLALHKSLLGTLADGWTNQASILRILWVYHGLTGLSHHGHVWGAVGQMDVRLRLAVLKRLCTHGKGVLQGLVPSTNYVSADVGIHLCIGLMDPDPRALGVQIAGGGNGRQLPRWWEKMPEEVARGSVYCRKRGVFWTSRMAWAASEGGAVA
jgi:hypothetical protein